MNVTPGWGFGGNIAQNKLYIYGSVQSFHIHKHCSCVDKYPFVSLLAKQDYPIKLLTGTKGTLLPYGLPATDA